MSFRGKNYNLLHVVIFLAIVPDFIFIFQLLDLKVLTLFLHEHDTFNYMQEVGHFLAAFPKKVKLSIPFFIPNITLGSFGAITQVSVYICSYLEFLVMEIVSSISCS